MGHRGHQLAQGDQLVLLDQKGAVLFNQLGPPVQTPAPVVGHVTEDLEDLDHAAVPVEKGIGRHVAELRLAILVFEFVDRVGRLSRGLGLFHGAGGVGAVAGGYGVVQHLKAKPAQGLLTADPRPFDGLFIDTDDPVIGVQDHDALAGPVDHRLGYRPGHADFVFLTFDLLSEGDDVLKQTRGGIVEDANRLRHPGHQILQNAFVARQFDDQIQISDIHQSQVVGRGVDAPVSGVSQADRLGIAVGDTDNFGLQPGQPLRLEHFEHGQTSPAAADYGHCQLIGALVGYLGHDMRPPVGLTPDRFTLIVPLPPDQENRLPYKRDRSPGPGRDHQTGSTPSLLISRKGRPASTPAKTESGATTRLPARTSTP